MYKLALCTKMYLRSIVMDIWTVGTSRRWNIYAHYMQAKNEWNGFWLIQ